MDRLYEAIARQCSIQESEIQSDVWVLCSGMSRPTDLSLSSCNTEKPDFNTEETGCKTRDTSPSFLLRQMLPKCLYLTDMKV